MTLRRRLSVAVAAVALTTVGCGPSAPDYQSIWSTTPTTTTTTPTEAPTQSFSEYLESVGVVGRPVAADQLKDLTISIPMPDGWQPYVNENLAPGTRTITKGNGYPSAMLVVFELTGKVDAAEAIKHADADAEMSENFKKLNGSKDNFRGFPSSMIEGSYDLQGQRMQSYNRVVIATGKPTKPDAPGQQYLVQLTVTSFADEAQADGPDIEAIIKGFTVKVP
ncbi:LpqN/LpqT family lipoprotein [Mycolicibacterium arenosum]|uniref:LpqN/LpqT family lipoprotein n=1 Tax=Mycolicibacterium arenosum TaxID=2952157 RepID=UPI0038CD8C74